MRTGLARIAHGRPGYSRAVTVTARTLPPLMSFSRGAGCGCKLGPAQRQRVLEGLTPARHPDLLVGTDTGDAAGRDGRAPGRRRRRDRR